MKPQETDYTRLAIAIFLSAVLLIGWQAFVEMPKHQKLAEYHKVRMLEEARKKEEYAQQTHTQPQRAAGEDRNLTHDQRLALSPRITVSGRKVDGSISLKGARFDNLMLVGYHETPDRKSPEVTLFAPRGDEESYFAQAGWLATDGATKVPDQNTMWTADKDKLESGETVTLRWNNGEGVTFILTISLDQDYMFTIGQRVENASGRAIAVAPYAYINRQFGDSSTHYGILHEGPLGVLDGSLSEISYEKLRDTSNKTFENANGWLGITDKYWLAALIPDQENFKATFSHYKAGDQNRYQTDFLGATQHIEPGASQSQGMRLFAGAKEIDVLDRYTAGDAKNNIRPIPLFDRAVDFGVLYFLTKPLFLTLKFFYALIGNFGLAIMLLTILVKLIMFPLANKSYHSMAQMRAVQPEMVRIRERYAGDHMAINKEMTELYKREKINPASGCLPIFIQMPVFFALYKVLYVTIEMRHAPFFGWITDLSATDPSNIFTLFGLLPWDHPAALHIGVLPILFCATMVIQMKLQPKPTDPVQAKVMAIMPYLFLYLFASFPAGLVLYWVWSNMLSILQQQYITRHHSRKKHRQTAS